MFVGVVQSGVNGVHLGRSVYEIVRGVSRWTAGRVSEKSSWEWSVCDT